MRQRILLWVPLGIFGPAAVWVILAWFFFGSIHPCGVLEHRLEAYLTQTIRVNREVALRFHERAVRVAPRGHLVPLPDFDKEEADIRKRHHDDVWRLSPYECLKQAITLTPARHIPPK